MRKSLTDASSPIFGVKIKTYFKPPPSYPRWHFEPQNQRWTEDHFPCHLGDFCLVPAVNFQGCKKKTLPIHLGKWSYFTKLDFCQIRGIPYILRWNLTVMLGSQKTSTIDPSIHPSIAELTRGPNLGRYGVFRWMIFTIARRNEETVDLAGSVKTPTLHRQKFHRITARDSRPLGSKENHRLKSVDWLGICYSFIGGYSLWNKYLYFAPENWGLEDDFAFGKALLVGAMLVLGKNTP